MGATVVLAQGRGEPVDGTMAGLTSEVRELRIAVLRTSELAGKLADLEEELPLADSAPIHFQTCM